MACSGCRKPPRVVRKPTVNSGGSTGGSASTKKQESQREKITGLKYVPKS